jgi:hypothetical protein
MLHNNNLTVVRVLRSAAPLHASPFQGRCPLCDAFDHILQRNQSTALSPRCHHTPCVVGHDISFPAKGGIPPKNCLMNFLMSWAGEKILRLLETIVRNRECRVR